jgi:predicted alpha/beta-hydrolase family hydrolase
LQSDACIVHLRSVPAELVSIAIPNAEPVSGLWQAPGTPWAVLVLAHGAGAGMAHRAMAAIADGLEGFGVATLRFQFPYMEKGGKRPDTPPARPSRAACRCSRAASRSAGG